MFGCAAVVTVPAVLANGTVPDTFAPATAFAVVANATAPDTFAPATEFATVEKPTAPVTLAPTTLDSLPASPPIVPVATVILPVTVKLEVVLSNVKFADPPKPSESLN